MRKIITELIKLIAKYNSTIPAMLKEERKYLIQKVNEIVDDNSLADDLRAEIVKEILDDPEVGFIDLRLPGGYAREYSDEILKKNYSSKSGIHSCTAREVFEQIDTILQQEGFDIGYVSKLFKTEHGEGKFPFVRYEDLEKAQEARIALYKITLHIYPLLRAKGLTKDDLMPNFFFE